MRSICRSEKLAISIYVDQGDTNRPVSW